MKFNEKLIKLRKAAGLSQEELGNRLNVARQTVSKWELGETTPEMDKLIKISEIFNITLDSLIKEENEEKTEEKINNTNSQRLTRIVIKILKAIGIILIALLVINVILIIIGAVAFNKIGVDIETNATVIELEENEVEFIEEL